MTYEEFKTAFKNALRESRLPVIGSPVETLDVRSMSRKLEVFVEPMGRLDAQPFHTSAAIKWRWSALQTARTATTEEDMLTELLGRDNAGDVETEQPWLRVDVKLRASIPMDRPVPMPSTASWAKWAHEAIARLDETEPLAPDARFREGRVGLREILAWQGEPSIEVTCKSDDRLQVVGLTVAAWQAIELPRLWDDSEREPDDHPGEQLTAMFDRVRAALHAWTEVLDHLR